MHVDNKIKYSDKIDKNEKKRVAAISIYTHTRVNVTSPVYVVWI